MITLDELAGRFSTLYDIDLAAAREAVAVHTDRMIDNPALYRFVEGDDEKLTDKGAALLRQQMSDIYGSGKPDVDDARGEVRAAVGRIEEYQGQRDAAVRFALKVDGVTAKDLAKDAKVSPARIYQIRDGRR